MIGHYLLSLAQCAEDAVLTTAMAPGAYNLNRNPLRAGPCLVGVAGFRSTDGLTFWGDSRQVPFKGPQVETRYDNLCERFGIARVNAAIRNRILANRARRVLTRELVSVGTVPGRPE